MRTDSTRQGGQDNEGRQSEMFHADELRDAARAVLEMHGAELGGRAPLYGVVLLVCSAHWSRWHRVPFCIDEYHAKGVPVVPKGSTQ
ncbi:unnamed protein product [Lampetra fluviatilis]